MGQTKEQRVIKQLGGTVQKKTPIATDMFIPNHSGIAVHPEAEKNFFSKVATNQYFSGSGTGLPYGEIYLYNNTTADSVATATLTQLTRFDTNGESNLCTPDHTNDHITIVKAGRYKISMSVAFSGDGGVTWTGGVYKNNRATQLTNLQTHRKLGASGDVGSASVTGIVSLAANDTIEVWFQHAAGVNKNITVKDCTLNVIQIGG